MLDYTTQKLNEKLRAEDEYLNKLPKCAYCGEPIQDDYSYKIGNEIICEDCLNDNFRVSTESLIDD